MTDLEQLAHSLSLLSKQEEFDININIPVIENTLVESISLNKIISKTNTNPITFTDQRLIFPHITLKMGTVKKGKFNNILAKMSALSCNLKKIPITPNPVIIKAPANKYYFSEINNEELLAISAELDKLLDEDMIASRFPLSKDNLHHITLGYKYQNDLQIAPVIGEKLTPFIADRIQISIMGKFGVCIGTLKTYYLSA